MQLVKQGQSSTRESILRVTIADFPDVRFTYGGKIVCAFSAVGFSYKALTFEMWEPADVDGFVEICNDDTRQHVFEISGYIKLREYTNRLDGELGYRNVFIVRTWKECNDHSNGNHGENPAQTIQEDAG